SLSMYLVLSTSLNPNSRSRVLAQHVFTCLQAHADDVEFHDLQGVDLPLCDGGACYGHAEAQRLIGLVERAKGVVLAAPIYNYDVGAAAKNAVEITGKAWTGKVVGFACAAGGMVSYMSVMGLANSLMLDFRSFIVPRFVYATGKAFDEQNRLIDEQTLERADQLAAEMVRVTRALCGDA
ncbi:MAG: NAD(P)H-dependent oxidoreductase, partial [Planctomycetales bacterium]|nr:NAD(P)H-dependent oxidoreductase [Planctomycetales bacterium]